MVKAFLLFLLVPVVAFAADKDPEVLAKEAAESAKKCFTEAKEVSGRALKASKEDAADLNKYAELTQKEGQNLLKASEAWVNNQFRLADRYAKKAGEYCEKRSEMIEKIYPKCEDKYSKKLESKDAGAPEKAKLEKKDVE